MDKHDDGSSAEHDVREAARADGPAGRSADPPDRAIPDAEAEGAALEEDIERLQEELNRITDRHLRLAAEFDNYRKRVDRERAETFGRAQADLVSRLLDAIDDLQRVTQQGADSPAGALLDGMRLVERKMLQVLEAAGLEAVDAEGARFDPGTMEAVASVAAESPEEDDIVSDVFQRGYRFKGQLVRPARVRVKQYEV
jgi:molecular chaperone GrpE